MSGRDYAAGVVFGALVVAELWRRDRFDREIRAQLRVAGARISGFVEGGRAYDDATARRGRRR